MNHIWLVMKITFKDGIRSRVLFGITLLAVALFASNIVITNLFAFELGKVMMDVSFTALSIAGLSVIFFLGIGMLSHDIHDKMVYMTISRPVTRTQFVLGKFGGLVLILMVVTLILVALAALFYLLGCILSSGATLPRNFSFITLLVVVWFQFLSLVVVLSFTYLFTIISSSMYLAMLFSFCIFVVGNSIETIVKVLVAGEFVNVGPLYVKLMKAISWLFPNLAAFDLKTTLAYGLPLDMEYILWTGIYGLAYAAIMITCTVLIFRHKDIC